MSPLLLHCRLCGRKQAAGILSGAAWGKVELADGASLSACPNCRGQHPDWEERLRRGADSAASAPESGFGGSYREA